MYYQGAMCILGMLYLNESDIAQVCSIPTPTLGGIVEKSMRSLSAGADLAVAAAITTLP
jgi:hypothetical protein